jgi:hypothetical protein
MKAINSTRNFRRLTIILFLPLFFIASCGDGKDEAKKDCPNKVVGKIRFRVTGHGCDEMSAGKDFLEQAANACKESIARDCESSDCKDNTRRCAIQPGNFGPATDPAKVTIITVPNDPLCDGKTGYYAVPVEKTDAGGKWYFDCECNCVPKPQ